MTDLGSMRVEGERRGLRFERHYDTSPDDLWSALTEPERLARWLAPCDIEPREGGAVSIRFEEGGAVTGRVLVWDPPRVLEYEWNFTGEAESVLRLELTASGDGTVLVLDHRLLGADQAPGYGAGWHAHLDALDDLLHGRSGVWDERFQARLPDYAEIAARARASRTSFDNVSMS
jgi:uncharacterized protein YndB with AHSA1/START domain